jgi:superfamily II DNA or RNA helicase
MKPVIELGDGYVSVTMDIIPDALKKRLRYFKRTIEKGVPGRGRKITGKTTDLFEDGKVVLDDGTCVSKLTTLPGFASRVMNAMAAEGYEVMVRDARTRIPEIQWADAMQGLRDYQMEIVYKALMSGGGIVAASTGAGKTCMASAIIRGYSHNDMCNRGTPISVMTCTDKDIARKNWQDLQHWLPDREVGLIMSGVNQPSQDVQVITTDSLHRIDPDQIGIMIVDEVHTVATEARAAKILAARRALRWGLSATPGGRFDGGDLLTEGLVGPVISEFSYKDGVASGALVPITVYWVEMPEPDCGLRIFSGLKTRDACYRQAVVRSNTQNATAIEILKRIPTEMQSLCIMQLTDQMNRIVGMYPGIRYIHAKTTDAELADAGQNNLLGISTKERKQIYDDFAAGKIRQILSTHVYKQGVNFPDLQVIVCPGGGGSDIAAGQIPGRGSRKIDGKDHAYLIDFWHPWDIRVNSDDGKARSGFVLHDDEKRQAKYHELGFEQIRVKNIDDIPFLRRTT